MNVRFFNSEAVMRRAIELASQGRGLVEPNPQVGCVIIDDKRNLLGEGFHQQFGGPHAEIVALEAAKGRTQGARLFVTLEPCCHTGKTPPCTKAIIDAQLKEVVVGCLDPSPHAAGQGITQLRAAGITVQTGLLEAEAQRVIAPFSKLTAHGLPYVHAKWAMTLDGKIAAHTGHSQWISGETSRQIVHTLRGVMDGVIVGAGTVALDDPLLTARPAGPRTAIRIVVDSAAGLPLDSQLLRTIGEAPVLVAARGDAPAENVQRLRAAGAEVLLIDKANGTGVPLLALLQELGSRKLTNVLVEGGSELLGSFFDAELIDEAHIFIAPKFVGGAAAISPISGAGLSQIPQLPNIDKPEVEILDGDVYIHGPLERR